MFFRKSKKNKNNPSHPGSPNQNIEFLSNNLSANEQLLRNEFEKCSDIEFRTLPLDGQTKMLFVYIDGFSDTRLLDDMVLKPILFEGKLEQIGYTDTLKENVKKRLVPIAKVQTSNRLCDAVDSILKGNVVILLDSENFALMAELKSWEKRGIEEPSSEAVIRGPRDGFTETLRVNTSLIRRRLPTTNLKIESFTIGNRCGGHFFLLERGRLKKIGSV